MAKKKGTVITIIIVLIVVILVAFFRHLDSQTKESQEVSERVAQLAEQARLERVMKWDIHRSTDEMTDKEIVFATATSINKAEFDFPYNGGSTLKIHIRKKDNKIDVFFQISSGQFVCSEYRGTDIVTIRFDDEEAIKYKTSEPSTGDSDYLFIKSSSSAKSILAKCKTAHKIKVQANFYNEGSHIFEFNFNEPLTDFD